MVIQDLVDYIRNNKLQVRIEIEGNVNKINHFIKDYNSKYNRNINIQTDGIRPLRIGANKFGIQRRVYFPQTLNMPQSFLSMVKKSTVFLPNQYPYRINSKKVVNYLFQNGFIVGNN